MNPMIYYAFLTQNFISHITEQKSFLYSISLKKIFFTYSRLFYQKNFRIILSNFKIKQIKVFEIFHVNIRKLGPFLHLFKFSCIFISDMRLFLCLLQTFCFKISKYFLVCSYCKKNQFPFLGSSSIWLLFLFRKAIQFSVDFIRTVHIYAYFSQIKIDVSSFVFMVISYFTTL